MEKVIAFRVSKKIFIQKNCDYILNQFKNHGITDLLILVR